MVGAAVMLSVFIREPEFQGQTKDRLATAEAAAHRRAGDQGPVRPLARRQSAAGQQAARLRHRARRRAPAPPRRKRKSRARPRCSKLRLPGKLADCTNTAAEGSELFIVEGDSAGGSRQAGARPHDPGDPAAARQDPQRRLRRQGQARRQPAARRPDAGARLRHAARIIATRICATTQVIIMTDADVDGAHIASLLITFFYRQMPQLIDERPPLSRGAAALPADRMAARRSTRATTRTRTSC